MVGPILFLLFFIALAGAVLVFQGVKLIMIADEIKAAQFATLTALQTIAGQQAGKISEADAAAILANEQANLAAATALITP